MRRVFKNIHNVCGVFSNPDELILQMLYAVPLCGGLAHLTGELEF